MTTLQTTRTDPAAARLAALVETMHQPVLVLTNTYRVRGANAAFCRLFEVSPEAAVGRRLDELAGERELLARLRALAEAVADDATERRGVRVESAAETGERRVLSVNARPVEASPGEDGILLAIDDLTERERRIRELAAETEYARKIVDAARGALLILDRDLRVRTANLTFYETFKVDPAATEGRLVHELGNGQWDIPRLRELLENILLDHDGFDGFEVEHDFEEIGRRAMLLNARCIDHTRSILLAIEDVTERRAGAAALAESEDRFRVLVESFSQVVWETDAQGNVLTDAPGWRTRTGQTREDWFANRWPEVVHPAERDRVLELWHRHLERGEELDTEFRLRAATGGWWWSNVRAAPIRDREGRVAKWVGVNVDVTRRKTAEQERELLLAELNHRVRNIFTVVRSLARQVGEAEDVAAFQAIFLARLDALSRSYTLALDHRWQRVDLHRLARLAVEPFAGEGGDRVELDGASVEFDGKRALSLGLAFHELATNALRHGALSLRDGHVRLAWTVTPSADGTTVHLIWREENGPPVEAPTRRGFGTRLIEGTFAHELGGEVTLGFAREGFTLEATWSSVA
jgi:PAS domain S-box-containing protein